MWKGNFRDLCASITRNATLSPDGRIDTPIVEAELARLEQLWAFADGDSSEALLLEVLGQEARTELDPFDRAQLAQVIGTCRRHASLSEAGRELFASSRLRSKSTNDADRLRKYLARFALSWDDVS